LREVEAALLAGEDSYRSFPYYMMRYGERGMRFTRSDSAWLVSLCQSDAIENQVRWLGKLLSARGMPRWLLEQHLFVLASRLESRVPEQAKKYAPLRRVADLLRAERVGVMPDERVLHLGSFFEGHAQEPAWTSLRAGALLAAAVADERTGIEHAVPSLERWLRGPQRSSARWMEAVTATLSEARKMS
jgi:hypothetical protein